jgi:hypothetical protein
VLLLTLALKKEQLQQAFSQHVAQSESEHYNGINVSLAHFNEGRGIRRDFDVLPYNPEG